MDTVKAQRYKLELRLLNILLPIVLLIALVSSLMPAQRAVRVSVREALAYE